MALSQGWEAPGTWVAPTVWMWAGVEPPGPADPLKGTSDTLGGVSSALWLGSPLTCAQEGGALSPRS